MLNVTTDQIDKNVLYFEFIYTLNHWNVFIRDTCGKSEAYMDSIYIKEWLSKVDADEIYKHLKIIGENIR